LGDGARTRIKELAEGKRKRSGEKKRRRKYRALGEGQDDTEQTDGDGEAGGDEVGERGQGTEQGVKDVLGDQPTTADKTVEEGTQRDKDKT